MFLAKKSKFIDIEESYVLEYNQKFNQDGNLSIARDMIYQKLIELGQRITDPSSQKRF